LPGTVVNCIAVDALNQKWVGTSDGVIVLSPDGIQQVATYTVASTNGKLIDNDVKSIAIDGGTGTVYFGTLSGLASLTTVQQPLARHLIYFSFPPTLFLSRQRPTYH